MNNKFDKVPYHMIGGCVGFYLLIQIINLLSTLPFLEVQTETIRKINESKRIS